MMEAQTRMDAGVGVNDHQIHEDILKVELIEFAHG